MNTIYALLENNGLLALNGLMHVEVDNHLYIKLSEGDTWGKGIKFKKLITDPKELENIWNSILLKNTNHGQ